MEELKLKQPLPERKDEIMKLYQSVMGQGGCTWDDEYPSMYELNRDLINRRIWVFEHNGKYIGSVSAEGESELEELTFWTEYEDIVEIARVVISPEYAKQGLAHEMLYQLFDIFRAEGKKAVHLVVCENNKSALSLYNRLHFIKRGECDLFNRHWNACELIL